MHLIRGSSQCVGQVDRRWSNSGAIFMMEALANNGNMDLRETCIVNLQHLQGRGG